MAAGIGVGSWSAVLTLLLPLWGRWFDQQLYGTTFVMASLMPAAGALLWMRLSKPVDLWSDR